MFQKFQVLVLLLLPNALMAGGEISPFALEAGIFHPTGNWSGDFSNSPVNNPPSGFSAGLIWQYRTQSQFQGRLRLGYLETGKAPEARVSYSSPQSLPADQIMMGRLSWRAFTIGYEWMPHLNENGQSGPFALLGVHGGRWVKHSSNTHPATSDPSTSSSSNSTADVLPSVLATYGLGYKFTPHVAIELRAIHTFSSSFDAGNGFQFAITCRL